MNWLLCEGRSIIYCTRRLQKAILCLKEYSYSTEHLQITHSSLTRVHGKFYVHHAIAFTGCWSLRFTMSICWWLRPSLSIVHSSIPIRCVSSSNACPVDCHICTQLQTSYINYMYTNKCTSLHWSVIGLPMLTQHVLQCYFRERERKRERKRSAIRSRERELKMFRRTRSE